MGRKQGAIDSKVKTTKIVVMTEHFLYLPLYYAFLNKFFKLLPPGHEITIVPSTENTDVSAFNALMDVTSEENRDIEFAVCDPACILDWTPGSGPAPVILAEMISNTAFWAIDRRTRPISFIKDLASFDRIIAFHPGTTSYGIASRIFRDAGKAESIKRVKPGQELVALRDSKKNTVALSPDILGIDQLVSNHAEYNIDFALGTAAEYNSVLLTALITRHDVAAQHEDLVKALLKALQRSLLLTRQQTPDVIRVANERFLGYGEEHVRRALERAEECHVFPPTIEVNEAHWIHAAHVANDARGVAWDAQAQAQAKAIYQQAILPYAHLAKSATRDIFLQVASALEAEPPKERHLLKELMAPLLWLILGCAATKWLHWSSPLALAASVTAGIVVGRLCRFGYGTMGWFVHWTVVTSVFVMFAGWQTFAWSRDLVLGIMATLIGVELSIIHAERKKG